MLYDNAEHSKLFNELDSESTISRIMGRMQTDSGVLNGGVCDSSLYSYWHATAIDLCSSGLAENNHVRHDMAEVFQRVACKPLVANAK
jgi:hypothetical protein